MPTERKTIGIIYNFSRKWMGGVIYILNAIKILNWLDDKDKPKIVLFYRKDLKRFVDEIDYPHLEVIEWEFSNIIKGYLASWVTGKNQFVEPLLKHRELDALFPMHDYPVKARTDVQMVSWYADLQHKYYPKFFRKSTVLKRNARINLILRNTKHLVTSSESVLKDFVKFYKVRNETKTHIFRFASVVDNFDFSNWHELVEKFELPQQYFIVSNQFHNHKNHKLILEALVKLKKEGKRPFVAMTGRLPDNDSPYVKSLRDLLSENELEDQVRFLGVINRHDQLTLMRYAQAVVQPSLFEGWSTVIEDAISLQTPVIAANLDVNIEQLGDRGIFFNPFDAGELADILKAYPQRKDFDTVIYEPYDERMKRAAESFISIFKQS